MLWEEARSGEGSREGLDLEQQGTRDADVVLDVGSEGGEDVGLLAQCVEAEAVP